MEATRWQNDKWYKVTTENAIIQRAKQFHSRNQKHKHIWREPSANEWINQEVVNKGAQIIVEKQQKKIKENKILFFFQKRKLIWGKFYER